MILNYTLESSFEAGLLVVTLLLYLYLRLPDMKSKVNYVWTGTGLALVIAVVLVYGVDFWGNRELFEFAWLSSIFPVRALLILTGRLSDENFRAGSQFYQYGTDFESHRGIVRNFSGSPV